MLQPSSGIADKRDQIFARPRPSGQPFQFDKEVAEVFDDMLTRSIPFYREVQEIILDLLEQRFPPTDGSTTWAAAPATPFWPWPNGCKSAPEGRN